MESVVPFLGGSLLEWVVLMVVIPIAQRLADFSLPTLGETAWKLLAIVVAKNLAAAAARTQTSPSLIRSRCAMARARSSLRTGPFKWM